MFFYYIKQNFLIWLIIKFKILKKIYIKYIIENNEKLLFIKLTLFILNY